MPYGWWSSTRRVGDEVIGQHDRWQTLEAVEFATRRWVDWFNLRRLLGPIGFVPSVEYEANCYQQV